MTNGKFTEKIAIITGAAGGIGQETVKIFAREGAKVVLVDLHQEQLDQTASALGLQENDYLTIPADVSKAEDVQNFVNETVRRFGRIDVFCNNAAVLGKVDALVNMNEEDLDFVMNINVKGVFFGLKYVMAQMIKQKSGSIVNTASTLGLFGSPKVAPYVASKHAVIGLTRTAAVEVAELGIRVNAVCPSPVNTAMMRSLEKDARPNLTPQEAYNAFAETIPMKRYAEPHEVAQVIAFLASDDASFVTGNCYTVDGGRSAK